MLKNISITASRALRASLGIRHVNKLSPTAKTEGTHSIFMNPMLGTAGSRRSAAGLPSKRLRDFRRVDHEAKMVTIEPVMDFDLPVMRRWMAAVKPCMIWLGYDSKNTSLVEPDGEKFRELHWALSSAGFTVILKKGPRSSV